MVLVNLLLIVFLLFALPSRFTVFGQTTLWDANHYEEYQPGDAPIIIDSPHGGTKNPDNRTCGTVNSGIDSGSQEVARLVTDKIQQMTGKRPHLIVNHLDRSRLDANRDKPEATCGDPIAAAAWEQFHTFIEQAKNIVVSQYGKGHYFDFHTQSSHGARTEMGILLSANQLTSNNIKQISSYRTLAASVTDALVLISGQYSLGGLLSLRGYRSVPSPSEPLPSGSYYNGAYNTYRHGSRNGGTIDGTQIENYYSYMTPLNRDAYAQALAETIVCFVQIYYQLDLNLDLKTRCGYTGQVFTSTSTPTPPKISPTVVKTPTPTITPIIPPSATYTPTRVPTPTKVAINTPTPMGPRYAACDLCGYCPPNQLASTWENCRQCLYPAASSDPASNDTLKVDPVTNTAPTPYKGRQYTMLGCIKTDLGNFSQEGAASDVVQTLLNVIFSVVGGVAFIYLIYGSFIILTSQGRPDRLNYGKRLISGAIIGITLSLSSILIVNFLAYGILRIPGFR